jgi:transcriptional regulator of NAD metabolism
MKAANTHSKTKADPAEQRRRGILAWMQSHQEPVCGGELAKRFRVSRQCLVQDVAILRASGEKIEATPEELQILVDHGVKILDVIVEHPVYGELRGSLMLESRADVQDFLARVHSSHAALLSSLTRGVHLHTVEASRPELIARAKAQLRARGFLLK